MDINVLLILILNCGTLFCQTANDTKQLITDLFTKNNYNKHVRPIIDQSMASTVSVSIDFYLAGISSLDEISEKLTTTGFLEITWKDEFLTWTSSSYGNLYTIHYPQSDVWKPDLSLQNGFTKLKELGSSFINVDIQSDGTVTWRPFDIFESHCTVDSKYFPFDEQTCDIVFVSWSYNIREVNLLIGNNGIQYYEYFSSNAEWSIIGSDVKVIYNALEVKMTFTIKIKRVPQYFVLNLLTPIVLLSILNLFTFAIPCDSGERTGYSITVWLSFAVFLTIINDNLPQSSTSIMAIYAMMQLFLTTICVIICTLQLRVNGYSEDKDVPRCLTRMVICFTKRDKNKVGNTGKEITGKENHDDFIGVSWKDVVSTFDFIIFWCLVIAVLLSTVICFCYVAMSDSSV